VKLIAIVILAALVLLVLLWGAICFGLAAAGGWRLLASRYRAAEPPYGMPHRRVAARIGRLDYGSTLTVYVAADGLFLVPMMLLRFGHPRLFIPWSAVTAREELRFTRRPSVRLSIGQPTLTTLDLPQRLVDEQRS
jgi:hypothetical protein